MGVGEGGVMCVRFDACVNSVQGHNSFAETTLNTCGSAPRTNAGISSLLNPNSVIPFCIPMACMYSRTTSANTRPASSLRTLAVLAPGEARRTE